MVKQISYGAHEDQHYDVYDNEQKTSQAWIVLIHGGYWRQKYSKAMMDLMIDTLIEAGYAVVNVEYRRGTAHPWPIPSDDVAAAIQHFKTSTYQPTTGWHRSFRGWTTRFIKRRVIRSNRRTRTCDRCPLHVASTFRTKRCSEIF